MCAASTVLGPPVSCSAGGWLVLQLYGFTAGHWSGGSPPRATGTRSQVTAMGVIVNAADVSVPTAVLELHRRVDTLLDPMGRPASLVRVLRRGPARPGGRGPRTPDREAGGIAP